MNIIKAPSEEHLCKSILMENSNFVETKEN